MGGDTITRILVCDDSRGDLEVISEIIDLFYTDANNGILPAPYALARFYDPTTALTYIEDGNTVDIAILDILMPEMNGMELAAKMREKGFGGYLIFLTSSNDFATQSYAVKAFSYILKPIALKTVHELLSAIEKTRQANDRNGFSLTRRSSVRFVLYSELMYVEVINHQLHFHLIDGKIISIYATLKEYSEILLRQPQMFKAQKSFIVNLDYVRSCENRALFMRDGTRISAPKDFESIKEHWLERMFGHKEGTAGKER